MAPQHGGFHLCPLSNKRMLLDNTVHLCRNILPFQSQLATKLGNIGLHATSIPGCDSKANLWTVFDVR